jgi:hypothetical protein
MRGFLFIHSLIVSLHQSLKESVMKKAIAVLLVLLLVIGGGAWYFVAFQMDSMIQKQIETSASISLGTQVSVGTVKTDIKNGSLTISGVTIANPPGFRNKNAFSLNGIEAAVDYANFDIKHMVIENPEIVIEEIGGETNFTRILAALEKQEADHALDDGKAEPIITVRHFRMNESRAVYESESLDRYSDLKVDAVELNNIKGTPFEVANIIATAIIQEITKEAAIELLKAKASNEIDSIFEKDKD